MRARDLKEGKKQAPAPVDLGELSRTLKVIADKLVRHPFYIEWDYHYGRLVKQKVEKTIEAHNLSGDEDEEISAIDTADLYLEYCPLVWTDLVRRTFADVRRQIKDKEADYQLIQGSRMDHEAGYESDMHFVEDSDWLRAMTMQSRVGAALSTMTATTATDLSRIVGLISSFVESWPQLQQSDQTDEPTLTEGMEDGLAATIPMLLLVMKKVQPMTDVKESSAKPKPLSKSMKDALMKQDEDHFRIGGISTQTLLGLRDRGYIDDGFLWLQPGLDARARLLGK